ncbi:hypothetical protein LB505_013979 [Fusarium chuoi]|nr:hypothetical protein LB505_013979 [Fusarium chuoi]
MKLGAASDITALIGATNGGYFAGGAFGSIFSGYFAHRYGRKKSAALAALIILISSALITASYHIAMFITFRVFQGWGSFQMLEGLPLIPVSGSFTTPAAGKTLGEALLGLQDCSPCCFCLGFTGYQNHPGICYPTIGRRRHGMFFASFTQTQEILTICLPRMNWIKLSDKFSSITQNPPGLFPGTTSKSSSELLSESVSS